MFVWKLEMIRDDGSNVMSSTPYTALNNSLRFDSSYLQSCLHVSLRHTLNLQ